MKLAVNKPRVVCQLLDNEVIIINFNTCFYYSLSRSAVDMWMLIEKNVTLDEVIEGVCKSYEGPRGLIEEAVRKFVTQLEEEGLIVRSQETTGPAPASTEAVSVHKKGEFADPVMQKYGDMQEMLLIDPIHEVDDSGWPNVKPRS